MMHNAPLSKKIAKAVLSLAAKEEDSAPAALAATVESIPIATLAPDQAGSGEMHISLTGLKAQ
ncbi:MAG: hypothetical protein ACSLEM_03140 [Candidatus Malihini olakiniferum]